MPLWLQVCRRADHPQHQHRVHLDRNMRQTMTTMHGPVRYGQHKTWQKSRRAASASSSRSSGS